MIPSKSTHHIDPGYSVKIPYSENPRLRDGSSTRISSNLSSVHAKTPCDMPQSINYGYLNASNTIKSTPHSTNFAASTEISLISGARVYVRLDVRHPNALWYEADVVSSSPETNAFLVDVYCTVSEDGHIESSDDTTRFNVSKANIAFSKPSEQLLSVSSHVIASLTSGIIAEKPNQDNGNKYLVFLENGIAAYFDQTELLQVVQGRYDFSSISVEMPVHYRVWLQDYFERYPKRLRPKYKKNELILYNAGSYDNPIWQEGLITRAKKNESLIQIKIESHSRRGAFDTFNVYRASPKLFKFHQLVTDFLKKNGKSFNPSVVMDIIASDQRRYSDLSLRDHLAPGNTSNYTLSIPRSRPSLRPHKFSFNKSNTSSTLALAVNGDKKGVLSRPPPTKLPQPQPFRRHSCSPSCSSIRPDLKSLRGLNPFLFPIYFGFRRDASNSFYTSPCGSVLDSLDQIQQYLSVTECVLDIDFFTFEPIEINNSKASCLHPHFTYTSDVAEGLEFQPISLINFINDIPLSSGFTYVADRIFDESTAIPKQITRNADEDVEEADPFLPCCDCTDNCSDPEKCFCIQLTANNEFARTHEARADGASSSYGYVYKRLQEPAKFGIYECNRSCPCNKYCPNRVVQNGTKCVLQIFMTTEKGWGVRTLYDIPPGTFVSTYAAKVMRDECVNQLDVYTANLDFIECAETHKEGYEETCHQATSDDWELFDLESGYSSSSPKSDSQAAAGRTDADAPHNSIYPLPRKRPQISNRSATSRTGKKTKSPFKSVRDFFPDEDPYVLDAQKCGNIGRFYNHSCDPNMFIQNVFIDTHDLRLPHVAFFTDQLVHAFDELTWDYSYEVDSVPNRQIDCKCATDQCRGRLL